MTRGGFGKDLNVKLIGCGGIGQWLVDPVSLFLNFNIDAKVTLTLVDGDEFEEKNRDRQRFDEIGPKAVITAKRVAKYCPNIKVESQPVYVTSSNIAEIIKDNDLVMLCVDNHKTRKLVSDHAETLQNVCVISGGNDYSDGNAMIFVRKDGQNLSPPLANPYHPEIINAQDKNPGDVKKRQGGCDVEVASDPQLSYANFVAAGTMVQMHYRYHLGLYEMQPGNCAEAYFDLKMVAVAPRTRLASFVGKG